MTVLVDAIQADLDTRAQRIGALQEEIAVLERMLGDAQLLAGTEEPAKVEATPPQTPPPYPRSPRHPRHPRSRGPRASRPTRTRRAAMRTS